MTFLFLFIEFLVISGLLLGAARFGITPVVVVVATMQLFQAIMGSTLYWEFANGLLLSPGSAVFFASNLAILLYIYETRGMSAARTIFYTIVGSNLVIVVLSALIYAHIETVPPVNFLDLPPQIFQTSLTAALVGTTVLALAQLIALTVFNLIRSQWPKAPSPVPMTIALVAALVLDTFGYLVPLFWSDPNLGSMLTSGVISKGTAGLIFGITWGLWAQRSCTQHTESLHELFKVLTWTDKAESFRSDTAEIYRRPDDDSDKDFTAAKTFEPKGKWSKKNYRRWLTGLPYGVCVFGDTRIKLNNANFATQVGETAGEDLRNKSIYHYLRADDLDELHRLHATHQDSSRDKAFEHDLQRSDGTTITVESVLMEMEFEGSPASVLLTRDISELKQLRDQISHADRLTTVGKLTATVAHEINNPLAFVLANHHYMLRLIDQLKTRTSPEINAELDDLLEAIIDSKEGAKRIESVVKDLGKFTRTESRKTAAVDVATVIDSSVNIAMPQLKHRARLIRDIGDDIPPVDANSQQLGQVVLNLLVNAAQAIEEGAATDNEIHVSVTTESRSVLVEIRDTGCGIEPSIQDQIMEPFFTTKSAENGTGLGLATCRSIVESLGGQLGFDSSPGQGSTFWFRLPIAPSHLTQETKAPTSNIVSGDQGQILIIDDDQAVARSFARILSNHEVTTCPSGGEALVLLKKNTDFDIIFCDLMMPNMTGMQFYEELLQRDSSLASRMVFITGCAYTPRAQSFLETVDLPCLTKPFEWRDVHDLIEETLDTDDAPSSNQSTGSPS